MHLKYHFNENIISFFVTISCLFILPTDFGWNIYYDPKHFKGEKDENMLLPEEKSTVSLAKKNTTVFKETENSTDKDSDDLNSGNLQNITIRSIYLSIYLSFN